MSTIDRQRIAAVNALAAMLAIARSLPGFEPPSWADGCLGLIGALSGVVRQDGVWQRPHPFKAPETGGTSVSNLKRQTSAPTTATAAILAVHFLPPAARTDGIGLRKGRAVIVAVAAVGIVAVAAIGRVIQAAMAMTVLPPAAPVGNVLWL